MSEAVRTNHIDVLQGEELSPVDPMDKEYTDQSLPPPPDGQWAVEEEDEEVDDWEEEADRLYAWTQGLSVDDINSVTPRILTTT